MIESDADRRNMLSALGGSSDIIVREQNVLALYEPQPLRVAFDDVQLSSSSHSLQCLWSDVERYGIAIDDPVSVPDVGDFFIADIGNENGMALITLRRP
jgi:hypothetical protein